MCMIHAVKILTMGLAQMVLQVPGLLSKYQVIVLVVVPPLREDFAKYVHTVCIGPSAGIGSTLLGHFLLILILFIVGIS